MDHIEELPKASDRIRMRNVEGAFKDYDAKYPPIVSLAQGAEIVGIKPSTLKRKISEGYFKDCVSARKPVRILRNKFVLAFFNQNKQ